jgi:hypothetical protein
MPKLGSPCGKEHPFTVRIAAAQGVPRARTFQFDFGAHYEISAVLSPTDPAQRGIIDGRVTVRGEVHEQPPLHVLVVPVRLGLELPDDPARVTSIDPELVANSARTEVGDYLPVPVGGVTATVAPVLDLRSLAWDPADRTANTKLLEQQLQPYVHSARGSPGVTRVVAVLSARDTQVTDAANYGALAGTQLIYGRSETLEQANALAHEIAHTIPKSWSDDEMVRDCGQNFHNQAGHRKKVAHGLRLLKSGAPVRQRMDGESIMSSGPWIDQCTYNNVARGLGQAE